VPKKRMCNQAHLGLATTHEILEELQARGDVSMVVAPGSPEGADGAMLSGLASAALKALGPQALTYRPADWPQG
jgi:hypothetical protein